MIPDNLCYAILHEDLATLETIVNSLHQPIDRFHFNFLDFLDTIARLAPHSRTGLELCHHKISLASAGFVDIIMPNKQWLNATIVLCHIF
jgi:hypothetical protein